MNRKYRVVECLVTGDVLREPKRQTKEYVIQYSRVGIFWRYARDYMGDILSFAYENTAWQFITDYQLKNKDPRKFKKLRVTGIDYGN